MKPKDQLRVVLGIPAYRSQCDIRAARSYAWLLATAPYSMAIDYIDICDVNQAHEELLRGAIRAEADCLIIMATDEFLEDVADAGRVHDMVAELVCDPVRALSAVPVALRGPNNAERYNVMMGGEYMRLRPSVPFACERIGTGLSAFNVRWYRNWAGRYFRAEYKADGSRVGTDILHCREVARRGGQIWCDPRPQVKHVIGEVVK